jgi:hypothetical protein
MKVDLKKKPCSFAEDYHDQLFYALDYIMECLNTCGEETDRAIHSLHRLNLSSFRLDKALKINRKEQKEVLRLITALGHGLNFLKEAESKIEKRIKNKKSR